MKLIVEFSYLIIVVCAFSACSAFSPYISKNRTLPKNLVLIIGDGMGPQQLGMLWSYNDYIKSRGGKALNIERLLNGSVTGLMHTKPEGSIVTESACSASEIASGKRASLESLGIGIDGKSIPNIFEKAKEHGKIRGLITDTRITHATPAAFAVHTIHRDDEAKIAHDLLTANIELMFGGGSRYFLPESLGSDRRDQRDLLKEANQKGYEVVSDLSGLGSLKKLPAIGLFSDNNLPDGIEEYSSSLKSNRNTPLLKEMTTKALELLSFNDSGFILMVEAGLIDWAGHRNDAGQLLYEMIKLDRVIGSVLDWAESRSDTLVVLTADHETGSFGFSYKASLEATPLLVEDPQGARNKWKPPLSYVDHNIFELLMNQKKTLLQTMNEIENVHHPRKLPEIKRILNSNLPYKFTDSMVHNILKKERIPEQWKPTSHKEWSRIDDFDCFYPDYTDRRSAVLSRQIAEQQGVVWGSGGHTATLVPIVAFGDREWVEHFTGIMSNSELGSLLQRTLGLSNQSER